MPRIARVVVPNIPHHVTQRGNRRQRVFFCDEDYITYKKLLQKYCANFGVEVWAYCLMPNHVHLTLVPQESDALRQALSEAHRRYTRYINFREKWRGYLWQGRFASFPMEEKHLLAAVRYVELNPVRARLCNSAVDWPWSSARAHLTGYFDSLLPTRPMRNLVRDWESYLAESSGATDERALRAHTRTGRPLGSDAFIENLEKETGRVLKKRKAGRPRKSDK